MSGFVILWRNNGKIGFVGDGDTLHKFDTEDEAREFAQSNPLCQALGAMLVNLEELEYA